MTIGELKRILGVLRDSDDCEVVLDDGQPITLVGPYQNKLTVAPVGRNIMSDARRAHFAKVARDA